MKITTISKTNYSYPLIANNEPFNYLPHNTYESVEIGLAYGCSIDDFTKEFKNNVLIGSTQPLKTTITPMLFNPSLGYVAISAQDLQKSIFVVRASDPVTQYADFLYESRAENTLKFLEVNFFNNMFPVSEERWL